MDPIAQASSDMNLTIVQLTEHISQIRPAMIEMLKNTQALERDLALIAYYVSMLEGTVDAFEETVRNVTIAYKNR